MQLQTQDLYQLFVNLLDVLKGMRSQKRGHRSIPHTVFVMPQQRMLVALPHLAKDIEPRFCFSIFRAFTEPCVDKLSSSTAASPLESTAYAKGRKIGNGIYKYSYQDSGANSLPF